MALEEVENKDMRLLCSMWDTFGESLYVHIEVDSLCCVVFLMGTYHTIYGFVYRLLLSVAGVSRGRVALLLVLSWLILNATISWQLDGA